MKLSLYSTLLVLLFAVSILSGQTKVIGTIIDQETGEPLAFTAIKVVDTKAGVSSDFDGKFELETTSPHLVASFLGYKSKQITIDTSLSEVVIKISLDPSPESIMCICIIVIQKQFRIHPAVTFLNKRAIHLNNNTTIAPALNTVPGVFMHSGALNTNRITIRGIGNRNLFGTAKIKAYLEGIPLTNGAGETTIEDIDLSILDAITVYKGPSSSIHGAGLGGMISLQVDDKILENKNTYGITSLGGSYGLARNTFNLSREQKGKSILNINANYTRSDGYRENNKYDRYSFTGFGKFKLGEEETINLFANYTNLNAQIPSSLDSTDFADNPEKAAFIWQRAQGSESNLKIIAGASYESPLGKTGIKQISSIYATTRQSYEVRPFNILRENAIVKGLRSELIYRNYTWFDFTDKFDFHLGGEFFDEDYDWQTYETDGEGSRDGVISDNGESRNLYNFFSQLKMGINYSVQFTAGLNYNLTRYQRRVFFNTNSAPSSRQAFPGVWSPFFNLGVDLSRWLKKDIHLSATASHGFSPPTVEESLNPNGTLNNTLVPERGWNYELALKGSFFSTLDFSVSAYSMQIRDLVVARRTDFDQFIGINAGRTSHNGLEIALKYEIDLIRGSIQPFLNYTYADYTFKEFIDGDDDFSGNDLTGTAPHLLNLGARYNYNDFYGNLIFRFVDAMPMRDDNSIYSDAYYLVDLKMGYRKAFTQEWSINFFVGINNILNQKYASMILINAGSFGGNAPRYYYPGMPINFYGGVTVEFGE